MKYLFILFAVLITLEANGQNINFPDANLKNALINHKETIDTNGDGEIQQQEAEAFTQALNIVGETIADLSGLEYFINVKTLYAASNVLTSVNLDKMPWLRYLDFNNNYSLRSLDIKRLANLEFLKLSSCVNLKELDFRNNVALKELRLFDMSPDIEVLDLTAQSELEYLKVQHMSGLKEIKWGDTEKVETLDISRTKISELNFPKFPALRYLLGASTLLKSIDIPTNEQMRQIFCNDNPELANVNLKNGRNGLLSDVVLTGNAKLESICVDDVSVSNQNNKWLKDSSVYYTETCLTSIPKVGLDELSVYPVPATDDLYISDSEQMIGFRIYNIHGQEVLRSYQKQQVTKIDISRIDQGQYVIQLIIEGQVPIYKSFIKLNN